MARRIPPKVMAKAAAGSVQQRRNGGTVTSFAVVGVLVLAVTALPLCILLIGGSLPTLVAVVVDRTPKRYLARTVGAINLAGIVPSALRLWEGGMGFGTLRILVSNPYTWLQMFGAAAIGWLLFLAAPSIARFFLDFRADEEKKHLEARAKTLIEEWGEEVTGRTQKESN